VQSAKKASKYIILLLALGIILAVGAIYSTRPVKRAELREVPPARIISVPVRTMDLHPVEMVTGRLQPAHKAALQFEVAGQVQQRAVEPGQRVTAGTLLLRLENTDYADVLVEARARLHQERAGIERDRRLLTLAAAERGLQAEEVKRLERLGRESLASRSKYDEARQRLLQLEREEARLRYSVETAEARLQIHRAATSRAQRNLARTELEAPFDGLVNAVFLQRGDYVSPNQPAVELLQVGQLDLYVEVSGVVAADLALGQEIEIMAEQKALRGVIKALQSDPNPLTHTYGVRIRVDGAGLLPGTLAQATVPLHTLHDVSVVPVQAVLREDSGAFVFTVNENTLHRVAVTLGRREGDDQVISSGVGPGDRIAARDVAALSDGQRVVY